MCSLGESIKTLRAKHKVTQQDLADALGVSDQSIYKWENGLANPDVMYIPAIAHFFRVPIAVLFTGELKVDSEYSKTNPPGMHNGVVQTHTNNSPENCWGEVLRQPTIDKLFGAIKKPMKSGKRVLLVDDAAFMRTHMRDILTKEGYEVIGEASNGTDALELEERLTPDIAVLDIVMPGIDGLDVLRQIKQRNANTVVVLCSSMASQQIITQAIDLGASWFIVKPFVPDLFIARINSL